MKNNGITVYTVLYKFPNASQISLMKSCATSEDHYFYAEEDDLSTVFNTIANQLSNLRLLSVK